MANMYANYYKLTLRDALIYKERLSIIDTTENSYVIDLSQYKGRYTLETAKKEIPEIEEDLILLYEQEIEKKLNIS